MKTLLVLLIFIGVATGLVVVSKVRWFWPQHSIQTSPSSSSLPLCGVIYEAKV
jgi:hypothetical protein